jgi:capsular exopolysaccharide synthesis family protein
MNNVIRISPADMSNPLKEAYKSLRTNLLFCGSDIKTIAFTSCEPNEGKSSVTMNLGVSLAEAGKKVIFVDADLRKSVIAGKYKITKGTKGLSHFLSGQYGIADIIYETNVPNFHMILAGPVPPNPAELLGTSLFTNMLAGLRKVYDYVIIDTPPLGSVVDSALVAKQCDGAILVVASGNVSYKFAQRTMGQLQKSTNVLGVVLNKVKIGKNSYYGRYYGKYYGDYYGGEGRE